MDNKLIFINKFASLNNGIKVLATNNRNEVFIINNKPKPIISV
jgi:hypothetical protein